MITVSYSEIKRFRFCRQAHYYNYVEGIVPRTKAKPLKIGDIIHQSIESWAKTGSCEKVLKAAAKEYQKMFEEEQEYYGDIPTNTTKMMMGYTRRYHGERKHYKLIEEKLGPVSLTKHTQLSIRVDRLTTTKAGLTLCETKTAKKIPDEGFRMWDLQTILYVWALRELGFPVKAILWDYIRTKPPTEPEVLKNGTLSKRASIDTDYETFSAAIERVCPDKRDEYGEILDRLKEEGTDKYFRRLLLPVSERMIGPVLSDAKMTSLEIDKLQHIPVRNISGFTCPRCFYSSLCQTALKGGDEDWIKEHEYMEREEETDYGSEEEEES